VSDAIPYYHVDAFTDRLFAGNPAGVCIVPRFPHAVVMQRIAAENGLPQTAFVASREDGDGHDLRWFTPRVEDDLCGHATLAAAYVLSLRGAADWPLRFHTRSGVLAVHRDGPAFGLDLPRWSPEPAEPPPGLLPALGLAAAVEVRRTRDWLVVVESEEAVRALRPDVAAIGTIEMGIGGVVVSAPGEGDVDYVCRFFAPSVGIPEDPATGSIHCTLGPYWARRLGRASFRARQLSARGGALRCDVADGHVRVTGQARLYLAGTLQVEA
jgi:predicted PhzF superfamily epimerase YddE/YHI9